MTPHEQVVLEALEELERAAGQTRQAATKPRILPIIERLDRLTAELPADCAPDLRHYLQRKSYEKARLYLQGLGSDVAPGRCGS